MSKRRTKRVSRKRVSRKRVSKKRKSSKSRNDSKNVRIVKFMKATNPKKKYTVLLSNGKKVSFGARGYEHYRDRTPLKLYSSWNHLDPVRRRAYIARHGAIKSKGRKAVNVKFSPAYLSLKYLW